MTITLTIDTHPHTNALIPDQVRSIVESALQKAKLGTVVTHTTGELDLEYLSGLLREANALLTEGPAEDKVQEALEYLKGH